MDGETSHSFQAGASTRSVPKTIKDKTGISTSPITASILAGSSCRLTTVSSKVVPTEREHPKDKFSRLPSLEKVSRHPVDTIATAAQLGRLEKKVDVSIEF
ncbi:MULTISPECIES: hypothetical protein [Mesorhizobium]|jgi:hypothetical protein|uniref:hypothetical protein n=1 Tax=Mesorhizobium TaxID=68287 RepID=UPI000FCB65B2|nr:MULTISPECIES: hypothetical protein [Mesorhizobium]RVA55066.1 hypothetical protein EN933_09120 [Mesorhizobium sp. M7A.F.Ca.US.001.01.1.1]WIE94610.1 hypothetical protein P9270_005785 [Mesorhizobium sp. WSM4875]MBE1711831.1 hypothetical protein [Mesorhizobium japonicum]MBE1718060.1 hypothetical protein [Mesorhizobium japonicum]MBZ9799823.1 hypothetical protein [Mesorhizobium sp. ES1-4]